MYHQRTLSFFELLERTSFYSYGNVLIPHGSVKNESQFIVDYEYVHKKIHTSLRLIFLKI